MNPSAWSGMASGLSSMQSQLPKAFVAKLWYEQLCTSTTSAGRALVVDYSCILQT